MIAKDFDAVGAADLAALITNGVTEARDLEFKRDLPMATDSGTKEFLADVSALANAHGGDLLFGIAETAGAASAMTGVTASDPDALVQAFESRIADGVEPRIMGIKTRWVDIGAGKGVVMIRVPASFSGPHRVKFKNNNRFWTRGSSRKYEMDIHELRTAFTGTEQLPVKFRSLHAEAIAASQGTNMPFHMAPDPYAVVSIAPLRLFREVLDLPIDRGNAIGPPTGGNHGFSGLITIEGAILYRPVRPGGGVPGYAFTHRTGRTDAAWTIGGQRDPAVGGPFS